jgi:hypothetical protein
MMKLLFLSPIELSQALKNIMEKRKGLSLSCEVGYSEDLHTDVASIGNDEKVEEIPIQNFVGDLNQRYNVEIVSYDVFEVGDLGEGFAFVIH